MFDQNPVGALFSGLVNPGAPRQPRGDDVHFVAPNKEEVPYVDAVIYLLREGSDDIREMVKAVLKPGLGKLKKEEKRKAG